MDPPHKIKCTCKTKPSKIRIREENFVFTLLTASQAASPEIVETGGTDKRYV
jgi:hypothetical protein